MELRHFITTLTTLQGVVGSGILPVQNYTAVDIGQWNSTGTVPTACAQWTPSVHHHTIESNALCNSISIVLHCKGQRVVQVRRGSPSVHRHSTGGRG